MEIILEMKCFFLSTHKCSCFDGQRIGGKVSHERTHKNIYTADPNRELFDTKTKKTNKHHSSYEFLTVSILNYIICVPFHNGFFGEGEGRVCSKLVAFCIYKWTKKLAGNSLLYIHMLVR